MRDFQKEALCVGYLKQVIFTRKMLCVLPVAQPITPKHQKELSSTGSHVAITITILLAAHCRTIGLYQLEDEAAIHQRQATVDEEC